MLAWYPGQASRPTRAQPPDVLEEVKRTVVPDSRAPAARTPGDPVTATPVSREPRRTSTVLSGAASAVRHPDDHSLPTWKPGPPTTVSTPIASTRGTP